MSSVDARTRWAYLAAFGLAFAAALIVAFAPVYSSGRTLVEVNGTLPLAIAVFALALAVSPLLVPRSFSGSVALGGGTFLLLTSFVSVLGVLFLPAAAILIYAGITDRRSRV